jgi:CRP-like cAMP-binding protein
MIGRRTPDGAPDGIELGLRILARSLELGAPEAAVLAAIFDHPSTLHVKGASCANPSAAAHLVLEGWLVRSVMLPDGRRQILEFLVPGDLVGPVPRSRETLAQDLSNLTPARVSVLSLDQLGSLRKGRPDIAFALIAAASKGGERLADQVLRLGRLGAYERTAHLLLELLFRLQRAGLAGETSYPLPVTQEELADALGLSSVHLNRVIRAMTADGLVEIHGRAARTLVTVRDPERLADIAMYDRET